MKSVVGLPLDFGDFKAHDGCPRRGFDIGQSAFVRACLSTKFVCALNARGTGKSVSLEILFWEEARLTPAPYEAVYVAQGHPQAEKAWEKFVKLCEAAGQGFLLRKKNKGQDRWVETRAFGRNSGTMRHFWSGEPGALSNVRGVRANRVMVDEAGFVHKDVEGACLPMLLARNGKMTFVGTARRGGMGSTYFRKIFERGLLKPGDDGYDPNYKSFNFPIESSPFITDEECRVIRTYYRDPRFPDIKTPEEREECDGAFISEVGGCFRNLDAAFVLPYRKADEGLYVGTTEEGSVITPEPNRRYVIGQDWGRKDDHSISSVFDRETRRQVALRIEPLKRSYDEYVTRLSVLKRYWNDALIVADDRGAGDYANSRLTREFGDRFRGISLTGQGESSKGSFVARMKDLFDMDVWRFLNVPYQKQEFQDYEQSPIGEHGNGFTYSAPKGGHDDTVSAAMFASTVLQISPPKIRPKAEAAPVLSPGWFRQKALERSASQRRGLRW